MKKDIILNSKIKKCFTDMPTSHFVHSNFNLQEQPLIAYLNFVGMGTMK